MTTYKPLSPRIIDEIKRIVGTGGVIDDHLRLTDFGKDATTIISPTLPELAVEATSVEQVQALLRLANQHRFPVTPRGMGTGLAGGAVPAYGGVVLSLARMNRILAIERENMIAIVEPGVINLDLKKAVEPYGLFYPPDPASLETSSLGGNAATNAGGPACLKYGTTRDYILGLEAVLPNGDIIHSGVKTRKGVVGYDLTRLLVGSEGTLAVITKLILKLIPLPASITTAVALFPDLETAMEAIQAVLLSGHTPCALEFLDRRCLELVGDLLPFAGAKTSGAFLLMEVDGIPSVIIDTIEGMGKICMEKGATNVFMAPDAKKRSKMWEVRKAVSLRIEEHHPVDIHEDIAVPIGCIAKFVSILPRFESDYGMKIYAFGHAGDGNIHLNITADKKEALGQMEPGIQELLRETVDMGGTISGEHGIGSVKRAYLPLELSVANMNLQCLIKRLFDPHLILNPGKVFI
jgi:glycolate oxidase